MTSFRLLKTRLGRLASYDVFNPQAESAPRLSSSLRRLIDATAHLERVIAAHDEAYLNYRASRIMASEDGSDDTLIATREAEDALNEARSKVIRAARKMLTATVRALPSVYRAEQSR